MQAGEHRDTVWPLPYGEVPAASRNPHRRGSGPDTWGAGLRDSRPKEAQEFGQCCLPGAGWGEEDSNKSNRNAGWAAACGRAPGHHLL